jgi:hypothetical protein
MRSEIEGSVVRFFLGTLVGWFVSETLRGEGTPIRLDDILGTDKSEPDQGTPIDVDFEVMGAGPGAEPYRPSGRPMHPAVKAAFRELIVRGSHVVARRVRDGVQLWIEHPYGVEAQVGTRTARGDVLSPDIEKRLREVAKAINKQFGEGP